MTAFEWRKTAHELDLLLEGSYGLSLEQIKHKLRADARKQARIERVLLHEFIETGRVMVIYDAETGTTMYHPRPEEE